MEKRTIKKEAMTMKEMKLRKFAFALLATAMLATLLSATAFGATMRKTAAITYPGTLTLTVKDLGKKTVSSWKSSNKAVATVAKSGSTSAKVTAKKKGKAKITAKLSNGSTLTCTVTVKYRLVKSVTMDKTRTLNLGKTLTLKATVLPSNASIKGLTWKSSNKNVATVSSGGKVTPVKAGTATITATAKDGSKKSASCKITVKKPSGQVLANDVAIAIPPGSITVGKSVQAQYAIIPSSATSKSVTWSSSNSSVATVNASGLIKGISPGTAYITAKAIDGSGKSATGMVTVVDDPLNPIRKGLADAKKKGPAAFISYYEHLPLSTRNQIYIGKTYGLRVFSYTVGTGAPINIEKDYGDAVKALYNPWIKSVHDKSLARFTNDSRAKLFFMATWLHSQYVNGSIKEIQRINGFLLCPSIASLLWNDAYPAGNCAAATSFMLDAAYYLFGYSGTSVHWDGSPHMGAGVLINGKTYLYDPQFGIYGEMINGKLKNVDDIDDDYTRAIMAVWASHTLNEVDYTM